MAHPGEFTATVGGMLFAVATLSAIAAVLNLVVDGGDQKLALVLGGVAVGSYLLGSKLREEFNRHVHR